MRTRSGLQIADQSKSSIERQTVATNKKIDELVNKLYGLTEEEMKEIDKIVKELIAG